MYYVIKRIHFELSHSVTSMYWTNLKTGPDHHQCVCDIFHIENFTTHNITIAL